MISLVQRRAQELGAETAFNRLLPFDERATVESIKTYLAKTMGFQKVIIESAEEALIEADEREGRDGFERHKIEMAEPASPSFIFYNTD